MLVKDTKVIFFDKSLKNVQDIIVGDKVKTKYGNKTVIEVSSQTEATRKFIFSDGFKIVVSNSQEFLLPTNEWKKVSELNEGDTIAKLDNNFAKIVDITDLVENQGVIIRTEDNKGIMLSNGMMVR